jgi:cation diffusion facilitator CzcD-associated flavoprotein CzcO
MTATIDDIEPQEEGKTMPPILPIAVIGVGPIGLAAAAHLLERGERPLLLGAGDAIGHAVWQRGHVRLFLPRGGLAACCG